MDRARRHQRALARIALIFLALCAELFGRSLSHRLDFGGHVRTAGYSGADYYPFLLAAVKVGVALMLARLAWRFAKAHATARAARRIARAAGARPPRRGPPARLQASPRALVPSVPRAPPVFPPPTPRRGGVGGG